MLDRLLTLVIPQINMIAQREIDWKELRDAFVKRPERPTLTSLSAEFAVQLPTISKCCAEQGWHSLRAAHLDAELRRADAAGVLLEAVKIDRSIVRSVADLALVALEKIKAAVESIDDARAPQTKLDALNTAGFAAWNFCKSLREAGVLGLPAGLATAGKEDNGRWNPAMLQNINLTVQTLVSQAKGAAEQAAPAKVESVTPIVPASAEEVT